jgi:peptide/nickel transport system substrate-binding protein
MSFFRWSAGIVIVVFVLLPTCLTFGMASPISAAGITGGKLVYGLTLSPSGVDPHVNASSELGIPLSSVYDPLVWRKPDGSFAPGLAKSWEISPDGLTYTFTLRDDVTFHDGTKFNAEAVKVNLDRIVDPTTKSQKAATMLGPYDHTEIVDEYTVRIHMKESFAPLLDSLSQVYIAMASPAALKQWGPDYQMHQVGTGPFQFKEYVPGDHLTLVAYPGYNWAPSFADHQGRAYLDEIEFRFFLEPVARAVALIGNEAQVMGEIPPQDADRLKANPALELIPVPIPGQSLQMFINTQQSPTDDLKVREALLYATDRQTIVNTIFRGYSPVAYGPLSANTPGFDRGLVGSHPFDPAKAKELLEEAGWTDAQGNGIREKNGQPLRLDGYLMTWGFLPEIGALLQAQLRTVGIDLQYQTVAYPAALEAARQGKHNLIPFNLSGTDPDILRTFFDSQNASSGFNWAKYADPQLDGWLSEGARTLGDEKRDGIYAQVQERIMDQALIIPLRDYVNINAKSAKVKNLQFDISGWFPFLYDVYLEP